MLNQSFKITVNSFRSSSVSLGPAQPLIPDFYHNTALQNNTSCLAPLVSLALFSLNFHAVLSSIYSQTPVRAKAFFYLLLHMFLQSHCLVCPYHIGLTSICIDSLTYDFFIYYGHDSRYLLVAVSLSQIPQGSVHNQLLPWVHAY